MPIVSFQAENVLIVQSVEFCNGVPLLVVRICENLRFETFHYGIKCYVDSWSKLEEIISYLNAIDIDHKKDVIQKQISVMSPKPVGTGIYGPEEIVRAFEYFATSRALYNRTKGFSIALDNYTNTPSKISKIDENTFLQSVFKNLESCQKCCIIPHDEVYVKKMMLYHGGRLFGKSVDDPSSLAKTVLGIVVLCLNGGPKFLTKMIPVARLHSAFLFEQINLSAQSITSACADVKAIISDGNRTNQAFLKLYPTIPSNPWLTMNGQYLLFDFVHLLKNIRNLWLTEKTGELVYDNNGVQRTAKWEHVRTLHKLESDKLVKLSDLNDISIAPKPVERQRVATCLRVFSEKNYNALLTHPEMNENIEDTAIFLNKVIIWWKILNVKARGADIRHTGPLKAPISSPDDNRLNIILQFGDMALNVCRTRQTN